MFSIPLSSERPRSAGAGAGASNEAAAETEASRTAQRICALFLHPMKKYVKIKMADNSAASYENYD